MEEQRKKKTKCHQKKYCSVCFVTLSFLTVAGIFPAAAAPVDRIKVRIEAESFEEHFVLDAFSGSDKYTVLGIEPVYEDETMMLEAAVGPASEIYSRLQGKRKDIEEENTVKEEKSNDLKNIGNRKIAPELQAAYEIEICSEEEDGFAILKEEDISFSGITASCKKAVRKDNGQTLVLTITLDEPGEIIGECSGSYFSDGKVQWKPALNAAAYYAVLYRNGKMLRDGHRTENTEYDFSAIIKEPGKYFCRIWPLTKRGRKGKYIETSQVEFYEEDIVKIRERWQEKIRMLLGDTVPETGWIGAGDTWYYLQKDGTLPNQNSLEVDGVNYYFDETGRWIEE